MNASHGDSLRLTWLICTRLLERRRMIRLAKTPFSFVVSVTEILLAPALRRPAGWPRSTARRHEDPNLFARNDRNNMVSPTCTVVPSMLQAICWNSRRPSVEVWSSLICGGEALPGALSRRFHERLPDTDLYQFLRPRVRRRFDVTARTVRGGAQLEIGIPIGRPIANTRIYVLNRQWPARCRSESWR